MAINFGAALLHEEPDETVGVLFEINQSPAPAPQKVNPYDLSPIKKALAPYEAQIDRMAAESSAVVVLDDKSNILAVEMASQAKRLNKNIEEARKKFVDPANQFVKAVNNLAKNYQVKLQTIETGLKGKISAYQTKIGIGAPQAGRS